MRDFNIRTQFEPPALRPATAAAVSALCHAAGQVRWRWCPVPVWTNLPESERSDLDQIAASAGADLSRWSLSGWRRFLTRVVAIGVRHPGWLSPRLSLVFTAETDRLLAWIDGHFARLAQRGGHYLTAADPDYPKLIHRLLDPPAALTLEGNRDLMGYPMVAIVGSRQASALAMRVCFELGREMARCGICVVSGGAIGCDVAAHHGVLASGIRPAPGLCVFAGGLDNLYPRLNLRLFGELLAGGGGIITERGYGAVSRPADFAARNRIIAGLAAVLVVGQAAERSGALITCRVAAQIGSDVAVLVHPPGDVRAEGGARLITDGALAFSEPAQVLELLQDACGRREVY